ncbi:MAG: FAD/NAD(P)-binding oxidoreductase [Bacteroidota bacterium]
MFHHQIIIVGGGNAGLSIASQLLLKNNKLDIGIIEPSEKHYYQPAWTLVGGGAFDVEDTVRDEIDFIPKNAKWIKDAVQSFDPDNNKLACQSGQTYSYDYLIVVPGIQLDWGKIKGLKETLGKNGVTSNYLFEFAPYTWECLKNFKGGNAIFTAPNTPVKCGGAPQKIMYLAGDYILKNGIKDKSNIHFYSGGTKIFSIKEYADTLNKVIDRYGINTHFHHNLIEVDGPNKMAYFENEKGEIVKEAFEFIHVTPPQSAPDFIKSSSLAMPDNKFGFIDVDKETMQHCRFSNVFAAGDVTNTPNAKTGAAVRKQAPVLVNNLLRVMNGGVLNEKYDGYGSCPLVTGYGKLVLAEFDYNNKRKETFPFDQSKERWSMWMLKKHVLPWLYWNRILQGKA